MPQRRKVLMGATTVVVVLIVATCGDRMRKEQQCERAWADSRATISAPAGSSGAALPADNSNRHRHTDESFAGGEPGGRRQHHGGAQAATTPPAGDATNATAPATGVQRRRTPAPAQAGATPGASGTAVTGTDQTSANGAAVTPGASTVSPEPAKQALTARLATKPAVRTPITAVRRWARWPAERVRQRRDRPFRRREPPSSRRLAQGPAPTVSGRSAPLGSPRPSPRRQPGQWTTFGYDYEQTRHVPLAQITKDNVRKSRPRLVGRLSGHRSRPFPGGQEGYPLVISGTVYVSTSFNHAFALDAATGKVKWHFSPGDIGKFHNFGLNFNRGLAFCDNTLYMLTLDMRIMAIDATTGKLVKQVNIWDTVPDAKTEYGYYETAAPICYNGTLLIGSSGGDNGFRGFVMAYNAKDLTPAWPNPYWTVPPVNQDWRSQGVFHGGGAVWMPVSIDTTTGTVYFSVGNPSPDFYPQLRPGNNPKTNSLIAVDLKTGQEKWWKQQQAGDQWDYDT